MPTLVTTVLVSHDGAAWLPRTLAALAAQTHAAGHRRRRRHRQHRRLAGADHRALSVRAAWSKRAPAPVSARPCCSAWRTSAAQPVAPAARADDGNGSGCCTTTREPDPRALEHLLAEVTRDPSIGDRRPQGARLVRPAAAARGRRHDRPQRPPRDLARAPRAGPGPARRHPAGARGQHRRAADPPRRLGRAGRARPRLCRCCATTSTSAGGPPWPATASCA